MTHLGLMVTTTIAQHSGQVEPSKQNYSDTHVVCSASSCQDRAYRLNYLYCKLFEITYHICLSPKPDASKTYSATATWTSQEIETRSLQQLTLAPPNVGVDGLYFM
ncbi:hypothetical protein ACHAW6_012071 [Cyclotella cf. meneghiniana]